jgi:hypothetical protein
METWRKVWRKGLAPLLSTEGLSALRRGLICNDERLMQGATVSPPPLQCVADWPVDSACALGYCGWRGEGLETVAGVEDYFTRVCSQADGLLGEAAAVRRFLNWYDETPRDEMRRALLAEVNRTLAGRLPCDEIDADQAGAGAEAA